jgi:2-polyprenyl-3-methyl-5-hydroxy-6-metoxy-1,4-benzoquinol methylase
MIQRGKKTDRLFPEGTKGKHFEFGKNWKRFLRLLDEDRILQAEESLKEMLGEEDLRGKSLVDIGCGSGLFSLAARRLGARVHSFDYDPVSVECTKELKRRYFSDDTNWSIEHGDVLDKSYLGYLGQFDVVYAWGVLHHTGAMRQSLGNIDSLVVEGGKLFISIYNDQGNASARWASVKKFYVRSSRPLRLLILLGVGAYWEVRRGCVQLLHLQNPFAFGHRAERKRDRGMSGWHDLIDWVGGYPFEVAKPEDIFDFYQKRRFELGKLRTCRGGIGCNEYLFLKKVTKNS